MISESMAVGVVLERRPLDNPWQDAEWRAVAVVPGAPAVDAWRQLDGDGRIVRFHAATLPLELFRKETEAYRYNLSLDPPTVYVVLRESEEAEHGIAVCEITASPYEAQVFLDAEENMVEPVPMPEAIRAWVAAFVERYHVDEPVYKRTRTSHDSHRRGGQTAGRA